MVEQHQHFASVVVKFDYGIVWCICDLDLVQRSTNLSSTCSYVTLLS